MLRMRTFLVSGRVPAVLLMLLGLSGCGRDFMDQDSRTQASPVVAVSMRGLSDGRLGGYQERGILGQESAFAHIARSGQRAAHLIPGVNAVTATSAATIETGVPPSKHGIVGHVFRVKGRPFEESASGFATPYSAEAVWEAADRQGKRVVRIGTIMLHGSRRQHENVKTLGQAASLAAHQYVTLVPAPDSQGEGSQAGGAGRFEHVQRLVPAPESQGTLRFEVVREGETVLSPDLAAFAVDTVRDGRREYQSIVLDDDGVLSNGTLAEIAPAGWASIDLGRLDSGRIGSWVKLTELAPDGAQAKIYLRAPQGNRGYPEAFLGEVEDALGFPTGGPNWQGYFTGRIDEQTVLEEIDREVESVMQASLFVLENVGFDLLQIDHSLVDRLGHAFYLTDPRQPGYSDEGGAKRQRFARHLQDGYRRSAANLQRLLQGLPDSAHLLVHSEYGFTPVHSSVAVEAVLAEAGFKVFGPNPPQVRLLSSKVSGHLYLNLQGREPDGTILAGQRQAYIERITTALRNFRDPRSGQEVFEQIVPNSGLEPLGLNHPQSGDIWLVMKPGYTMHNVSSPDAPLIRPPSFLGEHGYPSQDPEAMGILYYIGPLEDALPQQAAGATDVAKLLSRLLGTGP